MSKTKRKADKIRKKMHKINLDLGVWTPKTLSNRCVIKHYSWVLKVGDKFEVHNQLRQ